MPPLAAWSAYADACAYAYANACAYGARWCLPVRMPMPMPMAMPTEMAMLMAMRRSVGRRRRFEARDADLSCKLKFQNLAAGSDQVLNSEFCGGGSSQSVRWSPSSRRVVL